MEESNLLDEDHFDPNKDYPRIQTIDLDNNKMVLQRTDPYGFIYIHFERGQVPEHLKGAYTTWEAAREAVRTYLLAKGREEVKQSEPVVETPKKKIA